MTEMSSSWGSGIKAIAAIAIAILTGCTVGPEYRRPDVVVAQNWLEAGDARVRNESVDFRNWWHAFNDPVLDLLIEHAYKENLTLRIAGLRVFEARAQLGMAIGEIYPQTQQTYGSFQYNWVSEHAASPIPAFDFRLVQVGANASWELDFWGKFRRAIESANASWHATVADYDNALVSLTADVANSYIAIRTLEKRIVIARQNAEIQRESLEIAEARLRYGTVTQLDVEQANTVLNNTLAAVPALETQLRQAKDALSVLLGMTPGELSDYLGAPSEIPVSPPQVAVGIPVDLLRRRPDIRSAEFQAAAQSALIGVAKADLYPAFSLTGSFGFLSSDIGKSRLSDMFEWSSRNIQAGPSFQWNIFNYGQITNNVRVQDARFQQSLTSYQNAVLNAQKEVEDNLAAFLKAQDRAQLLTQSTASARKALDIAVMQYREGLRDFTAVLTAQQALLTEQDNLAVTLGNISSSLVGVYRSLGGGWEIREGTELVLPAVRDEMSKRTDWGRLLAPASYNPPVLEKPESTIRLPDW